MSKCPVCSREVVAADRFCAGCGASAAGEANLNATRTFDPNLDPENSSKTAAEGQPGRFAPGVTLDGRYRIIAALGSGGMGEVYRADDLKLGQPVALKFLPADRSADPDRLKRLNQEVRIARQVSHPNVCRVYDVGAFDGQAFLTMEYIDGEDLVSLLRRIGRLPEDKAVELARQLCAGLAAAHDKGVLHRDLKPHNIMIDGRGRIRITDFGLAAFASEIDGLEIQAGTPAYMAPEQLAGKTVSIQSDLYSLGLVLYEMFTGKRPFAPSHNSSTATPTRPSTQMPQIDPSVERLILQCLEANPEMRPTSALAVAAALPGGDPLAAALAAGATPSPEAIANAHVEGTLAPAFAGGLAAIIFGGMALLCWLAPQTQLIPLAGLKLSPEVLASRGRELSGNLGYSNSPAASVYRFEVDEAYIDYVDRHDSDQQRWRKLARGRPTGVYFWYRQGPASMVSSLRPGRREPYGRMSPSNPPLDAPGMVCLFLNARGDLLEFHARPSPTEPPPDSVSLWRDALFDAARLDLKQFVETAPRRYPSAFCDERTAWEGVDPQRKELRLRVEAAAFRGKPVYFQIEELTEDDWVRKDRRSAAPTEVEWSGMEILGVVIVAMQSFFFIGCGVLAWFNLRNGRLDRLGALRFAGFLAVLGVSNSIVYWDHSMLPFVELTLCLGGLGFNFLWAGSVLIAYLALEPYVRRRWPWRIISWNRLLAGRFSDPLLGRDVLYGATLGVVLVVLLNAGALAPTLVGQPILQPLNVSEDRGLFSFVDAWINKPQVAMTTSLLSFAFLFLFYLVFRREWPAVLLMLSTSLLHAVGLSGASANTQIGMGLWGVVAVGAYLFVLLQYGLLALLISAYFTTTLTTTPLPTDWKIWYAGSSLTNLLTLSALVIYALILAVGKRQLISLPQLLGDDVVAPARPTSR